jgi:hypothetical protein
VQIKESLIRFGIGEKTRHLLVARFDPSPSDVRLPPLSSAKQGIRVQTRLSSKKPKITLMGQRQAFAVMYGKCNTAEVRSPVAKIRNPTLRERGV